MKSALHVATGEKTTRTSRRLAAETFPIGTSPCHLALGDWCGKYEKQGLLPLEDPPQGSKECPNNCNNNIGVCDYDIGICNCPAGYSGDDCMTPFKRPCTNRYRDNGTVAVGHVDKDGRDLNWTEPGWTASRCGGICDDNIAFCFCDGKYKHIPAPPGSPYGTKPIQPGRTLGDHCKPKQTKDGKLTYWGGTDYARLYGPNGWCEADKPAFSCGCGLDGFIGDNCDTPVEPTCPNQCSGHGICVTGFCKCYDGYYGTDCARIKAGMKWAPGDEEGSRPWLKGYMRHSPAEEGKRSQSRQWRPLIYVYDLPAAYNTRMWQYRSGREACMWRNQQISNASTIKFFTYAVEAYLHETLLQSEHRTLDPEKADFFYVPMYTGCFMHPVYGWADAPIWGAPNAPRVQHAANMHVEAKRWIQSHFPFWNRSGGADHIWLAPHDEGACWLPSEVFNTSIILTHWGRMEMNHTSNTAYAADNYDADFRHPQLQPTDWREIIRGHPCYDPKKDLVIPAFKEPNHARASTLLGSKPRVRDKLLYFRGDVGIHRSPNYSRGIRQRLYKKGKADGWRDKFKIVIGSYADAPGDYSHLLATSKFCLVAPGDGWSPRLEDSVLHGCVPVIIMDNVHAVFETLLDYSQFSVRINESDVERAPEILNAITPEQLKRMQINVAAVAHRFMYTKGPLLESALYGVIRSNRYDHPRDIDLHSPVNASASYPMLHDAFHTIMQWLYSKMRKS